MKILSRNTTTISVFMAVFLLVIQFTQLVPSFVFADNDENIKICHATHSNDNPYVTQTVDADSIDGMGEGNGNSADHNRDDHQDGKDIIPPGYWDADGRNWTIENQIIYNNDCNSITSSSSPSPSPSASLDPSPSPSVSPSPSPSASVDSSPSPSPSASLDPSPSPSVSPSPSPSASLEPSPSPSSSPSSSNDNNNSSSSDSSNNSDNSSNTSSGEVLGAYAETGIVEDAIMNTVGAIGSVMTTVGSVLYGKKKKQNTF